MIFGGGILGSSLFAGCNNDDPVTPDAQPEIVFAKESLDVPAEGGPFQIEYTIENPVANATLSAKCNTADKISSLLSAVAIGSSTSSVYS